MTRNRLANLQWIREFLSYDRETGRFIWIKRPRGIKVWHPDIEAGCLRSDNYRIINWLGETYLSHHLVWWFETGELPEKLDHWDHDPSNNRFDNLRPCNQSQNGANQRKTNRGTSRFKGVDKHQKGAGWVARMCGKYIGYFQDEEDAARAYDAVAIARFGEFANPNFKENDDGQRS